MLTPNGPFIITSCRSRSHGSWSGDRRWKRCEPTTHRAASARSPSAPAMRAAVLAGAAGAGTGGTSAGRSPRPYAFAPASQVAPDAACSFPNNSLHIVSVEYPPKPDAASATGKP